MGAGGGGGDTLPLGGMHRILEKKRSGVSLDALSYVQEEKCHAHLCNNLDTNSCNKVYLQCYVLHIIVWSPYTLGRLSGCANSAYQAFL